MRPCGVRNGGCDTVVGAATVESEVASSCRATPIFFDWKAVGSAPRSARGVGPRGSTFAAALLALYVGGALPLFTSLCAGSGGEGGGGEPGDETGGLGPNLDHPVSIGDLRPAPGHFTTLLHSRATLPRLLAPPSSEPAPALCCLAYRSRSPYSLTGLRATH
jgi:hypothetical protein